MELLAVSQQEAAVYIAALGTVVVAMISGTYLVIANRKMNHVTGPDLAYDANTTPTGSTPVEMWLNRFERIERYQLWTMAVLVGQGAAFMAYCFFERADRKADGHRLSDRIDLIQMAVNGKKGR